MTQKTYKHWQQDVTHISRENSEETYEAAKIMQKFKPQ